MLKVTRQRVQQLAQTDGFPDPVARLSQGSVWKAKNMMRWSKKHRPLSEADEGGGGPPTPPPRDPERPQDDPWDANAVRFLLATPDGAGWRRGDPMECLREQPNRVKRQPERVAEARRLAERYGVKRRPDPGGKTIHFFRTDDDPHTPIYPQSSADRRRLLRGDES